MMVSSLLLLSLRSNVWNNLQHCTPDSSRPPSSSSPPPPSAPLPFYPLVHIRSGRCMDYGPSHTWHRTHRLRYIIILVENDVMHFKTFVLRTPSVPPQMMSLALCLRGREVVKRFVGFFFFFRFMLSPSCGGRAVLSRDWKKGRDRSKLGCGQLFITEADDDVTHNRCPWCNCTDVDRWVQGQRETRQTLWIRLDYKSGFGSTCIFGVCCQ